jgi:hypothetical protein
MFCPSCGLEERQPNQFCRACGIELRAVRTALATPDNITVSAASARDEIGRAFAAKIREINSAKDLKKVAEDVLPEIEKFLESPHEKRQRGLREGLFWTCIGIGMVFGFILARTLIGDNGIFFFVGFGVVAFFIGLSSILNALLFTIPKKTLSDKSIDAQNQRELDAGKTGMDETSAPQPSQLFTSVTEQTTHHLK